MHGKDARVVERRSGDQRMNAERGVTRALENHAESYHGDTGGLKSEVVRELKRRVEKGEDQKGDLGGESRNRDKSPG
jgi:hypothetical protein